MVLQVANITSPNTDLLHLLEEAYESIYLPAFPHDDERESLEKFISILNGSIDGVHIVVNVLGENLYNRNAHIIKGIAVSYYYSAENAGLLAYYAVARNTGERGLGKILVQSAIHALKQEAKSHGKKLGGAFIEVHDPKKVTANDDVMDPHKRVGIFESWGAKHIPIDYMQPPVEADQSYSDKLLLMNYPVDGYYCKPTAIADMLRGMYRVNSPTQPPEADPHFVRMLRQLQQLPISALPNPTVRIVPGYMSGTPAFNRAAARTPQAARRQSAVSRQIRR